LARIPPLNLAREFAAVAALRPADAIQIVAHHEKGGHEKAAHRYQSLTFHRLPGTGRTVRSRNASLEASGQGDLAVILMKPSLELVPVFLALWHVGAIPLVVDPGASKEQKLKSIEDIRPNVLVGIPIATRFGFCIAKLSAPSRARSPSAVFRRWADPRSSLFCACRKTAHSAARPRLPTIRWPSYSPPEARALQRVWFTPTPTARPSFKSCRSRSASDPSEICLACHPAFAIYFVGSGATVITPDMDPRYPRDASPACLLDIIRDQRPTVAFMQIPVVTNLVKHCAERGEKIPHLRKILTTGASVPIELVEGVQRVMAEPDGDLHVMYGATEALCISYATGRELLSKASQMRDGEGTYLGRPAPGITVKVIGISSQPIERWSARPGSRAAADRRDLRLRAGGYARVSWQARSYPQGQDSRRNGLWHRMGDAGYLDEDGGIWYCGRIADRLETAAGYFYSDLVEPIFNRHPRRKPQRAGGGSGGRFFAPALRWC
jgi:acyl-coenzyme A synthetase/AMP-(fatty) acid ligase